MDRATWDGRGDAGGGSGRGGGGTLTLRGSLQPHSTKQCWVKTHLDMYVPLGHINKTFTP